MFHHSKLSENFTVEFILKKCEISIYIWLSEKRKKSRRKNKFWISPWKYLRQRSKILSIIFLIVVDFLWQERWKSVSKSDSPFLTGCTTLGLIHFYYQRISLVQYILLLCVEKKNKKKMLDRSFFSKCDGVSLSFKKL